MNTNNVNNINTNKIINSGTIKIILYVLFIVFIVLISLIFNLNFSEPFVLINDPQDIISFCNSKSPSTTFEAPSFVTLFNCNASNPYITDPTPYNIVLSPINVCPINSYLYSPTNQCILIQSTPINNNLVAWYDPSDDNFISITPVTGKGDNIELKNKVTLNASNSSSYNIPSLVSKTGHMTYTLLSSNSITGLTNNLSPYNLLYIANANQDSDSKSNTNRNSFLTVNTGTIIRTRYTIFIVYNVVPNPATGLVYSGARTSLFGTSEGTTNKIGMMDSARFVGSESNPTNRTNIVNTTSKLGIAATGDLSYLSLYTASIKLNNNIITWYENIYNKQINKSSFSFSRNDTNDSKIDGTLGSTLHICGGTTDLKSAGTAIKVGFDGYLGEVLLYNTALDTTSKSSTSQYNMIVGYLRNKWNI